MELISIINGSFHPGNNVAFVVEILYDGLHVAPYVGQTDYNLPVESCDGAEYGGLHVVHDALHVARDALRVVRDALRDAPVR